MFGLDLTLEGDPGDLGPRGGSSSSLNEGVCWGRRTGPAVRRAVGVLWSRGGCCREEGLTVT